MSPSLLAMTEAFQEHAVLLIPHTRLTTRKGGGPTNRPFCRSIVAVRPHTWADRVFALIFGILPGILPEFEKPVGN